MPFLIFSLDIMLQLTKIVFYVKFYLNRGVLYLRFAPYAVFIGLFLKTSRMVKLLDEIVVWTGLKI